MKQVQMVAAVAALMLLFGRDAVAADRWAVIQVTKPNAAKVIDGYKQINLTVSDDSVIARFGRKVKWYQLQYTNPEGGNDCPDPGRSYYVTADRKSIELGVHPFNYCTWEVHIEWKD
ncbi:MAG: hypothetical protein AB7E72_21150 [Lysobacterales bacterium]